jgi:predicted SAM-dependent methyltransferase
MLKSIVRACADRLGITIGRKHDDIRLATYERMYSPDVLSKKPFINIGSGSFWHPYWTNVDYVSDWYGSAQRDVIHYDIMTKEPLPFNDSSIKVAYTSHTIEHVKDDGVANLFKEVFRVLEPRGIFRVTTGPDAELDYRALLANDSNWFYWDEAYTAPAEYTKRYYASAMSVPLAERWLHHVASSLAPNSITPNSRKYSADEVMEVIRSRSMVEALDFFTSQCAFDPKFPGNHVSWWTHDKVINLLHQAGFKTVYRSGYRQSASPLLRQSGLFDSTHPQMSLYVEAQKD